MLSRILFVFAFTLLIHMVGTLAYSVRLVGVKTGRIAVSFALFNILVLFSRSANSFQGFFLAKLVEIDLPLADLAQPQRVFNLLILAASIGTLVGAFFIPTFMILLAKLVEKFNIERSIPKLLLHGFTKTGIKQIKDNFRVPSKHNIRHFKDLRRIPRRLILLNVLVMALLTTGGFSALYAAFLNPDLRLTSSSLIPILTGLATVALVVFIDPFFSLLTDDCLEGKSTPAYFHKCVVLMVTSRLAGTILAQLLLIPLANVVMMVAR